MIHVTQGHEKGIGLEVFLKSLLAINSSLSDQFTLHVEIKTLETVLKTLNLEFQIIGDYLAYEGRKIKLVRLSENTLPLSTNSLESALSVIRQSDVLFTLPTSKDQLIYGGKNYSGYTEYFRSKFNQSSLVMIFKGVLGFTALLTDHIPLKEVPKIVTRELVVKKFEIIKENLEKYYSTNYSYIFSGINPHSGENGILGNEDEEIVSAIESIKSKYPKVSVKGPLPGDTLHFESNNRKNKVFIYAAHDQGLATFKQQNGLLGINTTLGLPFIRLSVDHGTAFELYGKNSADFKGCLFVLKEALRINS